MLFTLLMTWILTQVSACNTTKVDHMATTLGQFEQIVLTAIHALGKDAHSVAIHAKVTELADRIINIGAVYISLDRLNKKGLVSSWTIESEERSGKPKRFYKLEPKGALALKDSMETSKRMIHALGKLRWNTGRT